jgi:hypothetical protein
VIRQHRRARDPDRYREWKGGYRSYDLVKEFSIALGVVLAITLVLTILFSSPDEKPSTIKQWSRSDPVDFVTTAVSELDGTSAARDYVLAPLSSVTGQPRLKSALSTYEAASSKQQAAWTSAYGNALSKAKVGPGDSVVAPRGTYGPVSAMMSSLLGLAQAGGLDGALLTSKQFYQTDYTKPLLFMADGSVLANRAQAEHLLGNQWGMMNETGSYPGQSWLWLYTFWYQIKPFSTSDNADILVLTIMGVLSLAFILVPFIPGIRDIPRWIPIYRLIWRDHYRAAAAR